MNKLPLGVAVLLLVSFGLAAHGFFNQPFLTWDDSYYARLALPSETAQHVFQFLSLNYGSAKPAAAVTGSLAYLALGVNPWAPALVSLWMGTILLAVVFQWARQVSGSVLAGWLAVAILGSSFSLNLYSRWHSPQTPQMLFLAVAGLGLARWQCGTSRWWLRGAALAAGIAMLYHYLTAYAIVAVVLWLLFFDTSKEAANVYWLRLRNVVEFGLWCALPLAGAMGLSLYRVSEATEVFLFGSVRFYYLETLLGQVTSLGRAGAVDPMYYPRVVLFYEGIVTVILLVSIEVYFLLPRGRQWAAQIRLLRLLWLVPLVFLIASSVFGSDARPRALATLLPAAAVYFGTGFAYLGNHFSPLLRRPLRMAFIVLIGTLAVGLLKGRPLFQLTHPYTDVRDYVTDNDVETLIGWQGVGSRIRPNELDFLAREASGVNVVWADEIEELPPLCDRDPQSLLLVAGTAPEHSAIRRIAQFDNPIDQFVPTLLEEGRDRSQLLVAGYDLPLTSFGSKFLSQQGSGVSLYAFEQC